MIPLRMSTEICQLGEGYSLCAWECRSFPTNTLNIFQLETLDDVFFSVLALRKYLTSQDQCPGS